jgi:hypothetical protein
MIKNINTKKKNKKKINKINKRSTKNNAKFVILKKI